MKQEMRRRRTTWQAAARAAGTETTLRELRIWTRQKLVWTNPVETTAAADEHSDRESRREWTAPARDSQAA